MSTAPDKANQNVAAPPTATPIFLNGSVVGAPKIEAMIAGVVWHFWIAVPLAAGAVVAVVATIVGYLNKVTSTRYPPE